MQEFYTCKIQITELWDIKCLPEHPFLTKSSVITVAPLDLLPFIRKKETLYMLYTTWYEDLIVLALAVL